MAIGIGRRQFISALGGATVAWPLAGRAQQPALPVIGYLGVRSRDSEAPYLTALRHGLIEAGYIEGQNVLIEYRSAQDDYGRLPELAADLVRRQVAVIVAAGLPSALTAKSATAKIPIVFEMGADPIANGLVASLNRPGSNLTGVTRLSAELMSKKLALLSEMVPNAGVIAFLVNPSNQQSESNIKDLKIAARSLNREIRLLRASTDADVNAAFVSLTQLQAGALLVGNDPFFNERSGQLAVLAARHAIPAMHTVREFPAAGGLMSYGTSLSDAFRTVGSYVGRILNGEKAADLPVQQSTKFEFVINITTAKALGLTVPAGLLVAADQVIE